MQILCHHTYQQIIEYSLQFSMSEIHNLTKKELDNGLHNKGRG